MSCNTGNAGSCVLCSVACTLRTCIQGLCSLDFCNSCSVFSSVCRRSSPGLQCHRHCTLQTCHLLPPSTLCRRSPNSYDVEVVMYLPLF